MSALSHLAQILLPKETGSIRLEKVFNMHGVEAKGVDCPAIDGKGRHTPTLRRVRRGRLAVERQQGGGPAGDQGADQVFPGGPNDTFSGTRPSRRISAARCG